MLQSEGKIKSKNWSFLISDFLIDGSFLTKSINSSLKSGSIDEHDMINNTIAIIIIRQFIIDTSILFTSHILFSKALLPENYQVW